MFQESGDKASVESELASLREASADGVITPAMVVNYAQEHPLSALHSKFEWDDSKAAHHYRLWQARQMIASIYVRQAVNTEPIRAYVHLREEQEGYRETTTVCADKDLFKSLSAQFRRDMKSLARRYECLRKYHKKLFGEIDEL